MSADKSYQADNKEVDNNSEKETRNKKYQLPLHPKQTSPSSLLDQCALLYPV